MKEYFNKYKLIPNKIPLIKSQYFTDNNNEIKTENKKLSTHISTSSLIESAPTEKYTLTKLINSVSNYRRETGTDFKIDVSSIKPSKLFHVESNRTIGFDEPLSHTTSFIIKSKSKNILPLKDKLLSNSVRNMNMENEEKREENVKKTIIDFFPVDKLIKMETKFNILISKMKNLNELRNEFITWFDEFKNSPFYEFQW